MITRRGLFKRVGGSFAAMLALGGYAFAEPFVRLNVTRYALNPPGWTPGLKLRVVVLADIHACEPWMPADRIAKFCRTANDLEPDVILLLGDYISGMRLSTGRVEPAVWAGVLATLKAPLGVHAVLGNHDWGEDAAVQLAAGGIPFTRAALEAVGIPVYSNSAVRLEKDGRPFWLAGLEDQLAFYYRPGHPRDQVGLHDLPGTLAQVTDDAPIILMAHEPDIFPQVPDRVSLTLSGHTHGGQVRLFGYAPVVPSRYGDRYVYGHVQEDGRNIIVSGGLGCSGLPIRFGSPPEIVFIELG
ncbi:metallophosphoesterase [Rhizobium sp. LCM 4573]|uniref:metallophosphoesterase n=1 Tax=Rhizobium sp. LCM 4573 TaxID=1848291 RepID=UPI0008D94CCC|nr:metallophosphoesterase [Rhizobium sp. LCM 4573]OHV84588.1 metallophosphoesterase [Rhizobium sp. LCM 4573]